MRRILHLSDLHFGRDRPELLQPLVAAVNGLAPDLVAISGDFTQRARIAQFRAAAAFLARLEPPWLAVPGNHDTPLDNLALRLFAPWRRYRRFISQDLEPALEDDEIALVGVNTVNHLAWQRGHIGAHTLERVCAAFEGNAGRRMHIAMLHHPLEHAEDMDKRLMTGARQALRRLGECGADLVLSGHLHSWHAQPFVQQAGLLFVQAGTGLSSRLRGEPNDFNLLTIEGRRVAVAQWAADPATHRFAQIRRAVFEKSGHAWTAVDLASRPDRHEPDSAMPETRRPGRVRPE